MRGHVLLIVMLTPALTAKPQAVPSATGDDSTSQTQMMAPPPVSGTAYPTAVGSEVRTDYLRGGLNYTTAYIDNFFPGTGNAPLAETTLSVLPTIAFDTTTVRQHISATYSPGFTFYRPTSALDEVDNTASLDYRFRLTPHTALSATESFQDTSLPFNPLGAASGSPVSGAPLPSTPGIVLPYAKTLTNSANVGFTAQAGRNVMIGASGLETELNYPDPAQATGLYNSSSRGGSAFYNRRISPTQYFGAQYQYMDMPATPVSGTAAGQAPLAGGSSTTKTQTISGFYTFYPVKRLSISISGGPQYYQTVEAPFPANASWGPFVSASMGWQGVHTSFAASYSQQVTGGGGLVGAFHSKSANASARWQMARTWSVSASGSYSIIKNVGAVFMTGGLNGHSVSGSASLEHAFGNQISFALNYSRISESYGGISAISANPNSDRMAVSMMWHFERPVGR